MGQGEESKADPETPVEIQVNITESRIPSSIISIFNGIMSSYGTAKSDTRWWVV